MATKLWEDIKKGVKDTVTYASEKTEEFTAIGRLKMDIAGINRKKENKFKELGHLVYERIQQEKSLEKDESLKNITEEINKFDDELKEKEKELEEVRRREKKKAETTTVEVKEAKGSSEESKVEGQEAEEKKDDAK